MGQWKMSIVEQLYYYTIATVHTLPLSFFLIYVNIILPSMLVFKMVPFL
jgi:hypothetical protein